jgi:hypothetical protein
MSEKLGVSEVPDEDCDGSTDIDSVLFEIEREAKRLGDRCKGKRNRFRRAHYWLGVVAAVLAGVASVSALQDLAVTWVALLAGLAGALSAVQVFLQPAENATLHHRRYVNWDELAASISDFRKFELRSLDDTAAREKLQERRADFFKLRRAEPIP